MILDAAWTTDGLNVSTSRVTEAPAYASGVDNPDAGYAYVIDWSQRYAPNALADLWNAGYRVRTAEKNITLNGGTYSRGSLIVLIGRNFEKRKTR
ncbi:MAG: hypothetical protein U5K69_09285 [Balneolaceae bacterium]|nr:hypothetical protein [Balneolaceae bacterium]